MMNETCVKYRGSDTIECADSLKHIEFGHLQLKVLLDLPYITYTWMLGPFTDSVHMKYKLYIRDCTLIL